MLMVLQLIFQKLSDPEDPGVLPAPLIGLLLRLEEKQSLLSALAGRHQLMTVTMEDT